jgi:hypothetical protein
MARRSTRAPSMKRRRDPSSAIPPTVRRAGGEEPSSKHVGLDPGGVTWLDLIILDSGKRGRPEHVRPDKERMEAAQWIADKWRLAKRPIAPQRWQAIGGTVLAELKRRASAHGTTPERELKDCVISALIQSIGLAGGIVTADLRCTLRTTVNDLVTEDLLGPQWWRRPAEDSVGLSDAVSDLLQDEPTETELVDVLEDERALASYRALEARLELEAMTMRAHLGPKEAEVLAAVRAGERIAEYADRVSTRPGAPHAPPFIVRSRKCRSSRRKTGLAAERSM